MFIIQSLHDEFYRLTTWKSIDAIPFANAAFSCNAYYLFQHIYVRMYIYTPFSDSSLEEIAFISSNFSLQLVSEKNNLIKFD